MSSIEIMNSALVRKKIKRPHYSKNALARDLDISAPFLNNILKGKKSIPENLIHKLCKLLEFDDYTKNSFIKRLLLEKFNGTIFEKTLVDKDVNHVEDFLPLLREDNLILKKWYYLAVLEFISCSNFVEDFEFIAKKFDITERQVEETFLVFEKEGLIKRDQNGRLKKENRFLRIPTFQCQDEIRLFHSQMIEKSKENLNQQVSKTAFEKRLISGITVSVNPENRHKVKKILEDAIHNAASEFSKGDCTEVYQINIQLFPLTNSSDN